MYIPEVTAVSTQLISYAFVENAASFQFSEATYEHWVFITCTEGEFQYKVGDDEGIARVGELVLCSPGATLHRKVLKTLSFHYSSFKLQAFKNDQDVQFPYSGKLTWKNTTLLLQTLEHMRNSQKYFSTNYTEHLLNDLLYQVIREKSSFVNENKPPDPGILESIRYINENAFKELYLESIAHYVGFSRSQFTRKFQKQVGVSPSHYITELRVRKVCKLLIETDCSIEQIAEQSGFKNAFYLSRVFTKKIGINPSQYRKTHRV